MTEILARKAMEQLKPGDLYSVGLNGPYMVIETDQGLMALVLRSRTSTWVPRSAGHTCFISNSGFNKVRSDSFRLDPSSVVPFKDVTPGTFFLGSPQGFAKEEIFVMDLHNNIFKANGLPLEISFFPKDTMVETFDLVTDLVTDLEVNE